MLQLLFVYLFYISILPFAVVRPFGVTFLLFFVHFSHTNSKQKMPLMIFAVVVGFVIFVVVLKIFVTLWQTLRATLRTFAPRSPLSLYLSFAPWPNKTRQLAIFFFFFFCFLFWDRNEIGATAAEARTRLSLLTRSLRLKANTEIEHRWSCCWRLESALRTQLSLAKRAQERQQRHRAPSNH